MSTTPSGPVIHAGETPTEQFPWGSITWLDSQEITGTEVLTFGVVTIEPGHGNPEHHHPNCDEILYLLAGSLQHTLAEEVFTLNTGDLIHIPQGVWHRAWNEGTETAKVVVTYNTGRRQVVGEFTKD